MPVGALVGGGLSLAGSLGGAFISSAGAKEAADTQSKGALQAAQLQYQAAQDSLAFQKQVYGTNQQLYTNAQGYLSPFVNNGTNAMYSLASLYGLPTPNNPGGGASDRIDAAFDAFTKLPAYQFPFQQGNLALERQLNAQGRTQSGAQARETQQFGQGLASTYMMQNYVNPLMSIAGQGANAAGALASAGSATMGANNNSASNYSGINSTMGSQVGGSIGNAATAQASGQLGSANAFAGGLTGGMNNLAMYSALAYGGGGGSGTYSLSGPAWGGGNILSGDAYGGNSRNPVITGTPGQTLNAGDFGAGF